MSFNSTHFPIKTDVIGSDLLKCLPLWMGPESLEPLLIAHLLYHFVLDYGQGLKPRPRSNSFSAMPCQNYNVRIILAGLARLVGRLKAGSVEL
jgi:hypothetical protein